VLGGRLAAALDVLCALSGGHHPFLQSPGFTLQRGSLLYHEADPPLVLALWVPGGDGAAERHLGASRVAPGVPGVTAQPPSTRKRVLIVCTGNSCRSQMAEGWVNHLLGNRWQARSAGIVPAEHVHPLAVRVMAEAGVDISGHVPQHVDRFVREPWDLVVTVCDSAAETCPVVPGHVERRHVSFADPAKATGSEDERLAVFRTLRDEIRDRLLAVIRERD
jgi:arsenate reductase